MGAKNAIYLGPQNCTMYNSKCHATKKSTISIVPFKKTTS